MDKYLRSNHGRPQPFNQGNLGGQAVSLSIRHRVGRLSVAALLGSGLVAGMIPSAGAGTFSDVLIAQEVVEGLPPPPPGGLVPAQPNEGSAPSGSSPRYVVLVNGDSSRLLSQVQRIASDATVQEYQGQRVIQVAMFDDSDGAERQVQLLASRGIGAKILPLSAESSEASFSAPGSSAMSMRSVQEQSAQVAASPDLPPPDLLPSQPVPREVDFGGQPTLNQFPSPPALPADSPAALRESNPERERSRSSRSSDRPEPSPESFSSSRGYFVVIPGKQSELEAIANQVIRLGDGFGIAQLVQQTSEPRGPHVQVGPFGDRTAANRWNRYFRDFGMDSRLYVKR
ncbi:MAG: hypothetical protein HY785_16605 [Oscillatoriophycideae cyanobacterium NC_groundwater_1537_Pr4_S-0.65um_50_18]|nr:hypothetical protein [Oscillatoriophycideae cyanobacterium NC_groundwater_1537_Pr4_S-0.65um_50_18]